MTEDILLVSIENRGSDMMLKSLQQILTFNEKLDANEHIYTHMLNPAVYDNE
jgi:hypothetical protein